MKYIFYTLAFCNISFLLASETPLDRSAITHIVRPNQNIFPNSEIYIALLNNCKRVVYRLNSDNSLVAHESKSTYKEDCIIIANKEIGTPNIADFNYLKAKYLENNPTP